MRSAPTTRFIWTGTGFYNNEPFYQEFPRSELPQRFCTDAGFDADDFFQATMPRFTYVSED